MKQLNYSEIVDNAAKYIGVVVTVSFCMSYSYNCGHLINLGLFFDKVPVTTIDITKDALTIFPIAVGLVAIPNLLVFLSRRHAEEKLIPFLLSSRKGEAADDAADGRHIAHVLVGWWAAFSFLYAIIAWAFTGKVYIPVTIIILIIGMILFVNLASKDSKNRMYIARLTAIIYVFVMILSSYGYGNFKADISLSTKRIDKIRNEGNVISGVVLSTYDKGLLFSVDRSPIFYSWDEVKSIEYTKVKREERPPICVIDDFIIPRYQMEICSGTT